MNWRIWHGTIKASFDFESLLRAEISKELLGADKTEITPSGIVPLVLLATVLSASYICMFISVLAPETERKMKLTIGKRIREMRLAAGMSQEQLAEALCTKKCTISAYETDKIDIKSSILKELAAVLHCSASYLLEGNKETEVDARLETALKEIDKSGLTEIALIQLKALAMIK